MKFASVLWAITFLSVHHLHATPCQLSILPGGMFNVAYKLSTGPAAATNLLISGNITADVEFTNGTLTHFSFIGGNIAYSDANVEVIISTFPVPAKVKIATRNIVSNAASFGGTGTISTVDSVIENSGHFLIQDRGIITSTYLVGGVKVQEEIRNLADRPDTNPLVGETVVTATLIQDLGYQATYQIDFIHTRDENRNAPAASVNGTLNIKEKGSFSARGMVTVLGASFTNWALLNGKPQPTGLRDRDEVTGQPLVLLYGFGAGSGSWTPPLIFNTADGTATLTLPATGLLVPVRMDFSPDLNEGNWGLMNRENGQPALFNIGEAGLKTVILPSAIKGFTRLSLGS